MIDLWNYGGYVSAAAAVVALLRKELKMYGVKVLNDIASTAAAIPATPSSVAMSPSIASQLSTDVSTAAAVAAALAPAGSTASTVASAVAAAVPALVSDATTATAAVAAQTTVAGKAEAAGMSLISFGLPIISDIDPAAGTLLSEVLGGIETIYNAIANHKATVTATTTSAA